MHVLTSISWSFGAQKALAQVGFLHFEVNNKPMGAWKHFGVHWMVSMLDSHGYDCYAEAPMKKKTLEIAAFRGLFLISRPEGDLKRSIEADLLDFWHDLRKYLVRITGCLHASRLMARSSVPFQYNMVCAARGSHAQEVLQVAAFL